MKGPRARRLLLPLVPLVLPLLALGAISALTISRYISGEVDAAAVRRLADARTTIDLLLGELETLRSFFSAEPAVFHNTRALLLEERLSYEDYLFFTLVRGLLVNAVASEARRQPFKSAIYLYFPNPQGRVINSLYGISSVDKLDDSGWIASLRAAPQSRLFWSESRTVRPYGLAPPVDVITVCHRLGPPGQRAGDGVLATNLYRSRIEAAVDPHVLVLNEEGKPIVNAALLAAVGADGAVLASRPPGSLVIGSGTRSFVVTLSEPTHYGWRFASVVDQRSLTRVPARLLAWTAVLSFAALAFGIAASARQSLRNRRIVEAVLAVLHSEEEQKPPPPVPEAGGGDLRYILEQIILNYVARRSLEDRQRALTLAALQSQMNPHFLFNTLDAISWKAHSLTGGRNAVNDMIENLAGLLRYSLADRPELVTVAEEIEHARCYVAIQQFRYRDLFSVSWNCEAAALGCRVVRLLLQPLLENSVYHGIKPARRKGRIEVTIRRADGRLAIAVGDDGQGMASERVQAVLAEMREDRVTGDTIGLRNTYRRLCLQFGEDNCAAAIRSRPGEGTVVELQVPATESPDAPAAEPAGP